MANIISLDSDQAQAVRLISLVLIGRRKEYEMAGDIQGVSEAQPRVTAELIVYFALAFAITFGIGAGFIFFRPQFEAVVGSMRSPSASWPYYAAVSAPTVSALLVSLAFRGFAGVKSLLSGLIRPFAIRWGAVALLAVPAGLIVWEFAARAVSGAPGPIDLHAMAMAPLLWFTTGQIFTDPGPWGEETGWRGFALPRLLTKFAALPAAMILGLIWGFWHTPAFFVSGLSQFGLNYAWFLVGGVGLTIFMTFLYLNANGNYFVAG